MICSRGTLRGVAAAVLLLGAGVVQGALQPYTSAGAKLVYSTDQDLTWTADANLFKTQCAPDENAGICPNLISAIIAAGSPVTDSQGSHPVQPGEFYESNGQMTWYAAKAWVAYLNSITYGGATNWRLWEADPSDINCSDSYYPGGGFPWQYHDFGCTGSELGYLYYEEGGATPRDGPGPSIMSLTPLSVFDNLQFYAYWSGTDYAPSPEHAWLFHAANGLQFAASKEYLDSDWLNLFCGWAVRPGKVAPPQPIPTVSVWGLGLLGLLLAGVARARFR